MALSYYYIVALARSDEEGTNGGNTVGGAIVTLQTLSGSTVTLYDDASGSNGSTSKQTRTTGENLGSVEFWVEEGEYNLFLNGDYKERIVVRSAFAVDAPSVFGSISSLRSEENLQDGDIAILSSRENEGLSSGRTYKYVENSTASLNRENVITPLSGNGAWISISDRVVSKADPQGGIIGKVRLGESDKWSGKSINLLGDSISWGSNAPDVFNDSYCGVLRKFLQIEHQTEAIGFVSILGSNTNSVGTYNDFHSVTTNGAWTLNDLANASETINGMSRNSSSAGAYLDVVAPVETTNFRVMYRAKSSGGSFKVSNNNGSTFFADVSTSGDDVSAITTTYAMLDNGSGNCEIRIEVVSGDVDILGIQYFNSANDVMFNNFSHPGRRTFDISTNVIDDACSGSTLVWALGFNDRGLTGADRDIVVSRLNYMRDRASSRGIKLYIVDLNWGQNETDWLRIELIRVAREVDGATYIPFPELISRNGFSIGSGDLQSFGFLSDNAHPTPRGHTYIAEAIAKNMGLSASANGLIERLNEQVVNKGTFTPTVAFATNGDFTPTYTNQSGEYFVNGDTVKVILRVDFNTNAYTTASGDFRIQGLPFQPRGVASMFNYTGSIMYDMITLPFGTIQLMPQAVRGANRLEVVATRDGLNRVAVSTNHFPASTNGFRLFVEIEYPIV